jgi:hypothetical protein
MHLSKKERQELSFLEAKMATRAREELAECLCDLVRICIERMANDHRLEDVIDALLSHTVTLTHRERYRINADALAPLENGVLIMKNYVGQANLFAHVREDNEAHTAGTLEVALEKLENELGAS